MKSKGRVVHDDNRYFFVVTRKRIKFRRIEYIVKDIENGITHDGYSVEHQLPEGVDENIVDGRDGKLGICMFIIICCYHSVDGIQSCFGVDT